MAFESQGCQIFWSDTTAGSTAAARAVGEVVTIGGPDGVGPTIDVSSLESTRREFLMGLPDEGNIALTVFTSVANVAQAAMRADMGTRTKRKVVIKFNDNTTDAAKTKLSVKAYCLGFTYNFGVDAAVQSNITLKCAGGATLSSTI